MFCRKGSLQKIGSIICLFRHPQNPAAFPPVTCPLCCFYHHSPLLCPSNTGSPSCPPFLLSLPLREEPGECFVSGCQLAPVQLLLERWLESIIFSSFIWRCRKMQMGFVVSICICWDMCFMLENMHFHKRWGLQINVLRSKYIIRILWQYCICIQEVPNRTKIT